MRSPVFGAALALALLGSAAAQAPLEDPESTLVETLVVRAVDAGPAWWRVSDDDATVYILGVGEDRIPADVAWDQASLQRRLKGANSLIVGTRISVAGGLGAVATLLKARARLRSKTPLEETLPPPLRAGFVAARERLGKPASRYAKWGPLIAGERLVDDAYATRPTQSVVAQVLSAARKERVRVVDPARYQAGPFIRSVLASLTPAIQQQCLEGAISDASAAPAAVHAAAEGWARGDLAVALTEPRSFDRCLLLLSGGAELWRRARDDRATAILKALDAPGQSVAVVGLRQLLAQDGVLVQLKAHGVEITGPAAPP